MRNKLIYLSFLVLFLAACANPTLQSGGPSVPTPAPSSSGSSGGGSSGGGSSGGGSGGSAGGGGSSGGSSGGGSTAGGGGGSSGGGGPSVGMPVPGTGIPGGIPVPMPGSSGGAGDTGSTAGSQGQGQGEGDADGEGSGNETGSGSEDGQDGSGDGGFAGGEDIPVWEPQPTFGESNSEETEPAGAGSVGYSDPNVSLEEMEKTLEKAMGTFDEEILREQENARNQTGNNGSGAGDKEVIAGVGEFDTYGGSSTSGAPVSGSSSQSSGPGDGSGAYADDAPPPATDDDIVARQIREAALSEPDPEQRAVLWEEYERYKSGL